MFGDYSNKLYQVFESKAGHWTIGIIVIINAIILGVQTSRFVPENIAEILHHVDEVILGFFVIELLTKIIVSRSDFFRNKWNIFDFLIIAISLIESNDYLPILRAFRTLHLMSITDALPRTQHVIGGLWKALPGITNVLTILLLFFYIACVMGVFLFRDSGVENFQHVGLAMKSMFQVMTGDDWTNLMKAIEEHGHPYAWVYFISFYIIMVFIILNLFIGVVVGSMQAAEEEIYAEEKDDTTLTAILELKTQIQLLDKKLDAFQKTSSIPLSLPSDPPKP
ncbi:MAG: ion transporter [Janthinobacterium lividum]